MLKAFAIVVIFLLASTYAVAYSLSSGWLITVQTDKPYYYVGDTVYISGRLTYNDFPTQTMSVVIFARLLGSTGSPYHLKTTTTDQNGIYNDSFPLASPPAILGEYIVNVTAGVADTRCTNQTTFQLINPFVVPVTPLGTLATTISMISILGVYIELRKRKLARAIA